jgi:hypothetical protein
MEIRRNPAEGGECAKPQDFKPAPSDNASRLDRILHMIEAHEKLLELDSENEVRFENVLKYLRQEEEKERGLQKKNSAGRANSASSGAPEKPKA